MESSRSLSPAQPIRSQSPYTQAPRSQTPGLLLTNDLSTDLLSTAQNKAPALPFPKRFFKISMSFRNLVSDTCICTASGPNGSAVGYYPCQSSGYVQTPLENQVS